MIRDFARNIVSIAAFEQGQPVELVKQDKSSWLLSQNVSQLTIIYTVYAWDLSVRSAHFDDQHCFFNGTSVFVALAGKESMPHSVKIVKPNFALAKDWRVATSMMHMQISEDGYGSYESENYAELIDHPFEIAPFEQVDFEVNGVMHRMVFSEAPADVDWQRIAQDVQIICAYQCQMFADPKPPFEHYLFMTMVLQEGFGGLEHRASTALHCSHADLPKIYDCKEEKSSNYQRFLALCSHEYFHSWNVKRIKPAHFQEYRLRQEVNTELLWFFEGVTSYYDELILVRAGVITTEQYLDLLAKNITRFMRGKGRKTQTVTESSFDAWNKFYKQDENAVNSIVSYYVKGGLIAMLLDFEIQRITQGAKCLDDLMRLLWNEFGKKSVGVAEKQIQKITEQLCGQSMTSFFQHILYTTDELDFDSFFTKLGIRYQLVPEVKQLEPGGFSEKIIERESKCSLGIIAKSHSMGTEIVSVYENASAQKAGLSNKDVIIAVNGYRVTYDKLDQTVASFPSGTNVTISFFRREKLFQRKCELQPLKPSVCYLSLEGDESSSQLSQWLNA